MEDEGDLTCVGNPHPALARHHSSRVCCFSRPVPVFSPFFFLPPLLSFSHPSFSPLWPSSSLPLPPSSSPSSLPLPLSLHLFESISVAATEEPAASVAWFPALWQKVTLSLAGEKEGREEEEEEQEEDGWSDGGRWK